jgi:hypothetical protein
LADERPDDVAFDLSLIVLRALVDGAEFAFQLAKKDSHGCLIVFQCELWVVFAQLSQI